MNCVGECGSDLIKSWKEEGKASEAYEKLRNKSSFEGFLLKGITHYGKWAIIVAVTAFESLLFVLFRVFQSEFH